MLRLMLLLWSIYLWCIDIQANISSKRRVTWLCSCDTKNMPSPISTWDVCSIYSVVWKLHQNQRTESCYSKHYNKNPLIEVSIPSLLSPASFHGIQYLARAPHFHSIRTVRTILKGVTAAHGRGLHLVLATGLKNVPEIRMRPQSCHWTKVNVNIQQWFLQNIWRWHLQFSTTENTHMIF
jgi:hypothetical protein